MVTLIYSSNITSLISPANYLNLVSTNTQVHFAIYNIGDKPNVKILGVGGPSKTSVIQNLFNIFSSMPRFSILMCTCRISNFLEDQNLRKNQGFKLYVKTAKLPICEL